MKSVLSCVLTCLTLGRLLAQDEATEDHRPQAKWGPSANVELPTRVKAEPGKLTLYADFDHPDESGIPLFLVNRTNSIIDVDKKDVEDVIKLERQLPSGQWERVQSHRYSDCGVTSGVTSGLPSGMHFKLHGYRVTKGEPATVRYTVYSGTPISSNGGTGFFLLSDLEAARTDRMTLLLVPNSIKSMFDPDFRPAEIHHAKRLLALKLASFLGEIPAIRKDAEIWLQDLESTTTRSEEQSTTRLQLHEILEKPWGKRTGFNSMVEYCLESLRKSKISPAKYGSPDSERGFLWEVIAEAARIEIRIPKALQLYPAVEPSIWKQILVLALDRLGTADEHELSGIAQLMDESPLVDEYLKTEDLESLLHQPISFVYLGVRGLCRRDEAERVAKLGFKLAPEIQLSLISALAENPFHDERHFQPGQSYWRDFSTHGEVEKAFWTHVIQHQTVKVASSLQGKSEERWLDVPEEEFVELKSFWIKETEQRKTAKVEFDLGAEAVAFAKSVEFLGRWKNEENIPLLRELLEYPGYQSSSSAESAEDGGPAIIRKRLFFVVRSAASKALNDMGESVPKDLELSRQIPAEIKPK